MTTPNTTLIDIRGLKMHFPVFKGIIARRQVASVKAVDGLTFQIRKGETLGLVGESGCGKSTTGRAILQLYRPTDGEVLFDGEDLMKLPPDRLHTMRRRMQMIFQDPYASLNPRMTVGDIIAEPIETHRLVNGKDAVLARVQELMRTVGLDPRFVRRYPHEFSGGQRQRIGIARALASQPEFLVCDEPISALDVSIQAQIMNLMEDLQAELGLTYLFIAHDLSAVKHISDRIAVMYLGRMAEIADADTLYANPTHPYTQALISAVPIPDPKVEATRERIVLQGDVPSPLNPPTGCTFHTRCPFAWERCAREVPQLTSVGDDHQVACFLIEEPHRRQSAAAPPSATPSTSKPAAKLDAAPPAPAQDDEAADAAQATPDPEPQDA